MSSNLTGTGELLAAEKKNSSATILAVYGCTIFLSAFLLFQVQLIVGKYILPWFGGASAVWTTSLLIFQILLLGGYTYAHLSSERLSTRLQSNVHLAILSAAFVLIVVLSLAWPSAITPSGNWKPQSSMHPVWDVIVTLLVSAGLPYFVLSTTGPLLQRWFSLRSGSARTYRLYMVSNLGSLLGLLTFPFLLEPNLHMTTQGKLWAFLFVVFLAGCAWCAWSVRFAGEGGPQPENIPSATFVYPTPVIRLLWFLLAACASSMLLATTNLLCQEIITIPLLWVLPLSLYLLSFIFCFDHPRWYRREIFHPLVVLAILGTSYATRKTDMLLMPALLFVVCMVCHGELVKLKPDVKHLTSFYLSISAGGALGGMFVAILSPVIFRFFTEFQVSVVASMVLLLWCLYLDEHSWLYRLDFPRSLAISVGILLAAFLVVKINPAAKTAIDYRVYPVVLLVIAVVLVSSVKVPAGGEPGRRFYPAQVLVGLVAILLAGAVYQTTKPEEGFYLSRRNFYGVLRVDQQLPGKLLSHGRIMHGLQLNPPSDRMPTSYYGPYSGIGILLRNHPERNVGTGNLQLGLVGMGTGTLATYGIPGDNFRYYEINPAVVELSSGENPVFTFVRDSRAHVDIELGDARLLLEREVAKGEQDKFDVLVLDAFSGDAVPVHLLTTEAFNLYWKLIDHEHGVIAIHLTSEHVDLLPVIQGVAKYYNCTRLVHYEAGSFPSTFNVWTFLARKPEALNVVGLTETPMQSPSHAPPQLWTDDYSHVLPLIHFK